MFGGVQSWGRMAVVHLCATIACMFRGPHEGERNHVMLVESTQDYKKRTVPSDPFLGFIANRWLRQQGKLDTVVTEAVLEELHDSVDQSDWISVKPPRVALTQWGTFNDAMSYLLPQWCSVLIPLFNVGTFQGWCTKEEVSKFMKNFTKCDASSMGHKMSSKEARAKASSMFRFGGYLKVSFCAMMDVDFEFDVWIIVFVTAPWRLFHGIFQRDMISIAYNMEFHYKTLKRQGPFWDAIWATLTPYKRAKELSKAGIHITFVPGYNDWNCPFRMEQRRMCGLMWQGSYEQLSAYILGFSHLIEGYPCMFSAFLYGTEQEIATDWQEMQQDWAAFEKAKENSSVVVQNMINKSYFNWTEVSEMFAAGFSGDVEGMILNSRRIFSYHGDTTLLEKSFQVSADQERDASSKRMSQAAMLKQTVKANILSEKFDFGKEVHVGADLNGAGRGWVDGCGELWSEVVACVGEW